MVFFCWINRKVATLLDENRLRGNKVLTFPIPLQPCNESVLVLLLFPEML